MSGPFAESAVDDPNARLASNLATARSLAMENVHLLPARSHMSSAPSEPPSSTDHLFPLVMSGSLVPSAVDISLAPFLAEDDMAMATCSTPKVGTSPKPVPYPIYPTEGVNQSSFTPTPSFYHYPSSAATRTRANSLKDHAYICVLLADTKNYHLLFLV